MDRRVVSNCIRDMKRFDKLYTFYGKRFDIPFIRTRALIHDLDFPRYGDLLHEDLWFMPRYKLKLHSNRLENCGRQLLKKSNKTHLDAKYWIGALRGDKESLEYILKHCRYDVIDLERLHKKIDGYGKVKRESI